MTGFTLKQLEAFVSVVECGSFSRAAETLYLSQSTVSAHVGALEEALGEALLLRSDRHQVRLTAAGERAYPMAKKILADCRALSERFADEEEDGPLLLAASTVPAQHLLPGYLSAFLKKYPNIRYQLRRGDSAAVHRLLRAGDARLGFVGAKLEPETFAYVPLAEDTLVMVTQNNERYRALKKQGAWGRDLLSEPTVAREEGSGTDRTVQNYMNAVGYPKETLRILARVDDPETIKQMVAQGVGVSVLSALAVAREVADGSLLAFEMDQAGLRRRIYLIYRSDARLNRTEKQFADFLKKQTT